MTEIASEPNPKDPYPPQGVDLSRPSVARVYDWYLGGTANWAIDRAFGQQVLDRFPLLRPIAIANRLYLHRVVRYLAKRGIRQFLDIGSGVPTMGHVHAVADEITTDSHVVYVDYEPVAVAHSKILLEKNGDPSRHAAIQGDLRDPDKLWDRVAETGVIDVEQPLALLLIAVLHVAQPGPEGEDVGPASVARFRQLMVPGSYLAVSHITDDGVAPELDQKLIDLKRMYDSSSSSNGIWRSQAEIRELFGDFELIDPGMTWITEWHPEETGPNAPVIEFASPNESVGFCGVGRKRS
ncbi:MAG TPA: SAM-dependent methyltransferase [Pseudonocardiaceae bacterium]